jgi:hypothetical protein
MKSKEISLIFGFFIFGIGLGFILSPYLGIVYGMGGGIFIGIGIGIVVQQLMHKFRNLSEEEKNKTKK